MVWCLDEVDAVGNVSLGFGVEHIELDLVLCPISDSQDVDTSDGWQSVVEIIPLPRLLVAPQELIIQVVVLETSPGQHWLIGHKSTLLEDDRNSEVDILEDSNILNASTS